MADRGTTSRTSEDRIGVQCPRCHWGYSKRADASDAIPHYLRCPSCGLAPISQYVRFTRAAEAAQAKD